MDKLKEYFEKIKSVIAIVDDYKFEQVVELIANPTSSDRVLWIIGNGGSAATANHFATDLSRCSDVFGEPIKAISLCSNSALLTAIGNDFGFENVFSRQLMILGKPNDLVFAMSASGNSMNILKGIEFAKTMSIKSIALTGFDGGKASKISDYSIHVETNLGDYGVSEDSHSIICHSITEALKCS